MTRLVLNSRGLYATAPDLAEYVPAGHVCGGGCGIGWHVFPEPYHVETCANPACGQVVELSGTTWVHRDGGQQACWDAVKRQPRITVAAPAGRDPETKEN